MSETASLLQVKNLKVYFPTGWRRPPIRAVDDVSFHIAPGETLGLVGESGCGKTTTGRAIIGLYQPTGGSVYFENQLISGRRTPQQARYLSAKIAMVFQDPVASLNPRMSIEEIISEGLLVQGMKHRGQRLESIYSMLEKVGLSREHATRYPHEFSGGQRQRIGIARALINRPSFIIADEPVSALDVSIQAQIINLLYELKQEMQLTALFIAHDLSVVKYVSDRIGVMYMGKLVELATPDQLYQNPVHPYTRALLSAIPQPDPILERKRRRHHYDPSAHDYSHHSPRYFEIEPGHTVFLSEPEHAAWAAGGSAIPEKRMI